MCKGGYLVGREVCVQGGVPCREGGVCARGGTL